MQVIENLIVKEKVYMDKLENGLKVMIIPKKDVQKKYIIWGTNYGSNDSKFIVPGEINETAVPDGVAHFLEHKLFEQENGTNSLDVLTSIGVSANAYTTNDHTAYLYECIDNFYPALDEFMDYVQHPYFTDENVQKEKGIIEQEINMYDDYPDWKVYINSLKAMYHNHPVKLDTAGTVQSISKIDKEVLYKCYNTFYNPSNMTLVVCGDFNPEELLEEIKKRLINKKDNGEIKRIYPEEPVSIVKERIEQKMEVSIPLYAIGIKTKPASQKEKVRKHIALDMLLTMIFGNSSKLYQDLYNKGIIYDRPSLDYEFSDDYAYILISGLANDPEEVYKEFKNTIQEFKKEINKDDFERIKKMTYGRYIKEFDDITDISRMFLADSFKGINSFEYIEEIDTINVEYLNQVLKDVFKEDKMIISTVRN